MNSEIKVGVVFFTGLTILFVATVVITGFSFFGQGYTFPVYFNNIAGVEKGNRVLFSGVNVGIVDDITFKDGLVCLLIRVEEENVLIPDDSEVTIEQSNMLAGMQVSIVAGSSKESIREVKNKRGIEPSTFTKALSDAAASAEEAIDSIREPLASTMENIENITREIKEGSGTAHKLIYEEEIYDNVRTASEKLSNVLTEIDQGKGTVGKLLKDEAVYDKLKATLDEAEKAISGIKEIVEAAQRGEGTLGKFIKDEEVYDNVRDITRDAKEVTAKIKESLEGEGILAKLFSEESGELYTDLKDTASEAKKLVTRLNAGEGTLGKLFASDELYDDVKAITGNLRTASEKLTTKDNTIGKLLNESNLYDKAEKALDGLDETLGAAARMKVFVHLGFFSSNHPFQESRYQINFKVWPCREGQSYQRYFLIGATITDVGETTNYIGLPPTSTRSLITVDSSYEDSGKYFANPDFQLAWVFDLGPSSDKKGDRYSLTLRGGLIDGLVGGGVDVDFWRYFRLTGEARVRHANKKRFYENISPCYARAYLSIKLFKYFRIYVGADNVADQAVVSFGVSIEWEDRDIKSIVGIAGSAF